MVGLTDKEAPSRLASGPPVVLDVQAARRWPWGYLLAGLGLAAVTLALALSWLGKPFPGFLLEKNMTVTSVYSEQWAGFRAGIQVGDEIRAVDGTPVSSTRAFDRLVRRLPAGTLLTYQLDRQGRPFSLRIPLSPFTAIDVFTMFVMWWLLGLVFLGLGTAVRAIKPFEPASRAFFWFCMTFSLFSLTNFESVTTHLFSWVNILSLAFVGPTAGTLALRMPVTPGWVSRRPLLATAPLWAGGWLAALTLVFYRQPEFWKPVYLADTLLVGSGLLAIPVAAAAACVRSRSTAAERAQGMIVLAGAISGIVPTLVVTMAAFAGVSIPGSEVAYLLTLIFPISLAYAIVRWRLFDVEIVVKRTLVYAVVTVALATFYFASTAGLMALWGQQNARWASVLATAAVALAFAPLRDRTKDAVDRLFYRQGYDFGHVMADFAQRARRTLDPRHLLEAFASAIDQALHPQAIAIYLPEDGELRLRHGEPPEVAAVRAPIVIKGEAGLVVLGPRRSDQPYKAQDRELVTSLAGQLALWLENSALFAQVARQERIRRELEIAHEVQSGFLPQKLPEVPGVEIAACTRPALEVGGDFYDVIDIGDERLAILVGDVSGKGVPAALLMAMTVMVFRSLATTSPSPARVLAQANDLIWLNRPSRKMFVTAFYGVLDRRSGEFTYANAGQPFPLTATGPLAARGMALGVVPGSSYVEHYRVLKSGEAVMIYSDGVEDAINPSAEHFGPERLADAVRDCWELLPGQAHDHLLTTIDAFTGGAEPFDDLTLLTIRRA